MEMKTVFKNQFGELRSGWQIVLFILALAGSSAATTVPLVLLLNVRDTFALSAAALVSALLATLLATRFINRKTFIAVGLAVNGHTMRELGIGWLVGWLMMTGVFGVEYARGYLKVVATDLSFTQAAQTFAISIVFFAVAAMFEEVLFRGYLFQTLVRGINVIPSVVVMGVLFSLAHFRNPNANAFGLINTILVAILFCYAYWRTRGLWLPFGIHFAWNFSQTTLYGYPTSGIHFSNYELTKLTQFGPDWITGGAYGPEGGALATLMILLCGVYLYFSQTLQPYPGIVTLETEEERLQFRTFESRAYWLKAPDGSGDPSGRRRPVEQAGRVAA